MSADINKFEGNGRLLSYKVKPGNNYVLTVLVARGKYRNYYDFHCRKNVIEGLELKVNSGINVEGEVISHRVKGRDGNFTNMTFLAATQVTQESYFKGIFEENCKVVNKENYFRGAISGTVTSVYENNGYTSIYVRSVDNDNRIQMIRLSKRGSADVKSGDYIKATYNGVMRTITTKDAKEQAMLDAYVTQLEVVEKSDSEAKKK